MTNKRLYDAAFRLKLDDSIALSLFNTKYITKFLDHDSYAGVFICVLLFPMMSVHGNTSGVTDVLACLYASMYLNLYYLNYW